MENLYNLPNIKQHMAEKLAEQVIREVVDPLPDNVIPLPVRSFSQKRWYQRKARGEV